MTHMDHSHDPLLDPEAPVHDEDLLVAVNHLASEVKSLSDNLTVSQQQQRRTRFLTFALIVLVLIVGFYGYNYGTGIQNNVKANKDTQVQQCQNSNSVRESNILLWDQIITLSIAGEENSSPGERAALVALQDWIGTLYRPRDCSNLDKVYDNPPPPDFRKIISGEKVSGN